MFERKKFYFQVTLSLYNDALRQNELSFDPCHFLFNFWKSEKSKSYTLLL